MSEFITWFEKRYNMPYTGVKGEDFSSVAVRIADAMNEWAGICANKALNGTAKFIRAEKRRVRSQKHKEVVACDVEALQAEISAECNRRILKDAACPTVSQFALVKEAISARQEGSLYYGEGE